MLGDPGLREGAAPLDGPQRVAAAELLLARRRRLEVRARDHALRKVVHALEPVAARDDELACGEEMLEGALGGLPRPHLARCAATLEGAGRECATLADRLEHVLFGFAVLALATPPVLALEMDHAPLEEGVVLDGEEARLVSPVLEDPTLPEQSRHRAGAIPAEPRGQGQPVGTVDGRDGVELDRRQPLDLACDVVRPRRPRSRRVALVRDEEAAKLGNPDRLHVLRP